MVPYSGFGWTLYRSVSGAVQEYIVPEAVFKKPLPGTIDSALFSFLLAVRLMLSKSLAKTKSINDNPENPETIYPFRQKRKKQRVINEIFGSGFFKPLKPLPLRACWLVVGREKRSPLPACMAPALRFPVVCRR